MQLLMNRKAVDGLEYHLAEFAGMLRKEGVPVGTAELLDALQALQVVDLASRNCFKTALQATMVKSYRWQEAFDRLFERYFVPPETYQKLASDEQEKQRQWSKKLEEADSALWFKGQKIRLTETERIMYSSLPEEQKRSIKRFVAETESGKKVEAQFLPLLEAVVKGHLRYWYRRRDRIDSLRQGGGGEGAGSGEAHRDRLHYLNMQEISEADLPAAEALLYKLSQQLAKKLQRRQRSLARRGPLDVRRTLRANMRFGGSLFQLKNKSRQKKKLELVLFCDVSASMQRYSTFVLQFIYGFQSVIRNLESFIFADGLEYISPSIKRGDKLDQIIDRVVFKSRTWGGGTNLAASLKTLLEEYGSLLTGRTSLIVVSDTRTVTLDAALRALREVKKRVREVIWLNPLPLDEWALYRSVHLIGREVEMWPCCTIAQLEQVITGRLLNKPAQGGMHDDSTDRLGREGRNRENHPLRPAGALPDATA